MTPSRPQARCTQCNQLATKRGRCDQHQRKAWETKSANSQALTGRQRQRLRDRQLAISPTCGVCAEKDTSLLELDHIVEIADGGAPLDPTNTWLLCVTCHGIKTQAARRARNTKRQ